MIDVAVRYQLPYSLKFLRAKIFVVCQISLEKVIFVIKISWIGYPLSSFCLKCRAYESSMLSSAIVMYIYSEHVHKRNIIII